MAIARGHRGKGIPAAVKDSGMWMRGELHVEPDALLSCHVFASFCHASVIRIALLFLFIAK